MNTYEAEARTRKAMALTTAALAARDGEGFTPEDVEAFTDDQWAELAEIAGVRPPSEVTKALVVQSMRVRLQVTRRIEEGAAAERDAEGRTADDVFAKLARGSVDDLFSGLGR